MRDNKDNERRAASRKAAKERTPRLKLYSLLQNYFATHAERDDPGSIEAIRERMQTIREIPEELRTRDQHTQLFFGTIELQKIEETENGGAQRLSRLDHMLRAYIATTSDERRQKDLPQIVERLRQIREIPEERRTEREKKVFTYYNLLLHNAFDKRISPSKDEPWSSMTQKRKGQALTRFFEESAAEGSPWAAEMLESFVEMIERIPPWDRTRDQEEALAWWRAILDTPTNGAAQG